MDTVNIGAQIAEMGRRLLAEGLVARTWGNISARVSEHEFLITPSGKGYNDLADDDMTLCDLESGKWEGHYKPSSEKGIHAAAYRIFPEAGFVIHTHQAYASAIGVAGYDGLLMSEAEREVLGQTALADYGLPGTKKLREAVETEMKYRAQTILMRNHGAVIVGKNAEDAYRKVILLEEICRRNFKGELAEEKGDLIFMEELRRSHPYALSVGTGAAVAFSNLEIPLKAQLDDMAQMIGGKIGLCRADVKEVREAFEKVNAVLIKGWGAIVNGRDQDDSEALKVLVDKAALCALQSRALGVKETLPAADVALMNLVYNKKYSKKKGE